MTTPNSNSSPKRRDQHVRPHVLVVTSDADLRDFLQEGLLFGGFWVSVIASGVQTLEVFRLRTFDLVLIDGALVGFDAGELIRRLRLPDTDDGTPRTDVPLLVIVDDIANAVPLLAAGADEAIAPPIEIEELVPNLHDIVRDWRARHPDRPWADQLAQAHPG